MVTEVVVQKGGIHLIESLVTGSNKKTHPSYNFLIILGW